MLTYILRPVVDILTRPLPQKYIHTWRTIAVLLLFALFACAVFAVGRITTVSLVGDYRQLNEKWVMAQEKGTGYFQDLRDWYMNSDNVPEAWRNQISPSGRRSPDASTSTRTATPAAGPRSPSRWWRC